MLLDGDDASPRNPTGYYVPGLHVEMCWTLSVGVELVLTWPANQGQTKARPTEMDWIQDSVFATALNTKYCIFILKCHPLHAQVILNHPQSLPVAIITNHSSTTNHHSTQTHPIESNQIFSQTQVGNIPRNHKIQHLVFDVAGDVKYEILYLRFR